MDALQMTQDQFFDFCQQNADTRFERTVDGQIIIVPPSDADTGFRDVEVCIQLGNWARTIRKGRVTGSSGGFILPNGANRAPDAAWITQDQIDSLTAEQRKKFLPLCPYFLIEVLSPSDSLKATQEKMDEYIANGCKLAWLIDPSRTKVHIYRPAQPVQVLDNPQSVSADPELPGFVLDLQPVWTP
jgi:Uma2 family endonuclease